MTMFKASKAIREKASREELAFDLGDIIWCRKPIEEPTRHEFDVPRHPLQPSFDNDN